MKNNFSIEEYNYLLPEERIALHPLPERSSSKLLLYKNGEISHKVFSDLPNLLPPNTHLVLNNTRVLHARLKFKKHTTATLEIFCLSPEEPAEIQQAMAAKKSSQWNCSVGNMRRWREGDILTAKKVHNGREVVLNAELEQGPSKVHLAKFFWEPQELTFSQILEIFGDIPLPPYLNRPSVAADAAHYQTVYARTEGAVAAPTAGLHFTPKVFAALEKTGIRTDYLTLHVSAGTFQPVEETDVRNHPMHVEQVLFTRENIENLLGGRTIVAAGTTSMRALESLYWFGVRLLFVEGHDFYIEKLYPYTKDGQVLPTAPAAFEAILQHMDEYGLEHLAGHTQIMIMPGYKFRVCDGLITNFHTPRSTLLMLIAAFIGPDWKKVYKEALENDYRFLSYGDSSLLWRRD